MFANICQLNCKLLKKNFRARCWSAPKASLNCAKAAPYRFQREYLRHDTASLGTRWCGCRVSRRTPTHGATRTPTQTPTLKATATHQKSLSGVLKKQYRIRELMKPANRAFIAITANIYTKEQIKARDSSDREVSTKIQGEIS